MLGRRDESHLRFVKSSSPTLPCAASLRRGLMKAVRGRSVCPESLGRFQGELSDASFDLRNEDIEARLLRSSLLVHHLGCRSRGLHEPTLFFLHFILGRTPGRFEEGELLEGAESSLLGRRSPRATRHKSALARSAPLFSVHHDAAIPQPHQHHAADSK